MPCLNRYIIMNCKEGYEWFEILDLISKKRVFINTFTGKCQKKLPDKYHQKTDDQLWEFYDFKAKNFYYYDCQTKLKTWDKPKNRNCVSFVKFQMLKERMKKKFYDATTQTNFEPPPLHIPKKPLFNTFTSKVVKPSNTSPDNSCTTSNNNVQVKNLENTSSDSIYREYSTYTSLPATRKPNPRTNPNCDRKSSSNYRLSQPILFHDTSAVTGVHLETVSMNCLLNVEDSDINSEVRSATFSGSKWQFPRESIINKFGLAMPVNTEIWSLKLFNRSDSQLAGIMSWSLKSIQDSLLAATPKSFKKKACMNFKQIQMYMGDRKSDLSEDLLALEICRTGISISDLSNEIFMQLCKQVTHNPKSERTFKGWELICICLMFFHPQSLSMKSSFQEFIEQYACINKQINLMDGSDYLSKSIFCARISRKLLQMSNKAYKVTVNDIVEAKKSYSSATIFFSSLDEVMQYQERIYSNRKLPWIQVALTREILRCGGAKTQGILRIPSEVNKIEALNDAIEKAFKLNSSIKEMPVSSSDECDPLLNEILNELHFDHDPLLLSSVLKHWLRHLRTPLMSFDTDTESLIDIAGDYSKILNKLNSLPEINHLVLKYLIYFLQILAEPENVAFTNMPVDNLVTLMAPTLFQLELNQLQAAMSLLGNLITNLNTSDIADMI